MKLMTMWILLLAVLLGAPGCGVFDMVLDASYQSGKRVLKENLPILKADLFKEAEKLADESLEKAKAYAREKTIEVSKNFETKLEARTGVPAPDPNRAETIADYFAEMKRWRADMQVENDRRRVENERRERDGKEPGPKPMTWYEQMFWTAVAGTTLLAGRSAQKRDVDKRIGGYIRNVFGPNPGNGNGNGDGTGKTGDKK